MRLLLDIHIDPRVSDRLAQAGVDAVSLRDWRNGDFRRSPDELILSEAHGEGRVFVTYDQRSVPNIIASWDKTDRVHSGVVLIDDLTVRRTDIGGVVRAIRRLALEEGDADWTNRVDYLRRYRQ